MKTPVIVVTKLLQFLVSLTLVRGEFGENLSIFSPAQGLSPPGVISHHYVPPNTNTHSIKKSIGYNSEYALDYGSKCNSKRPCNKEKFLECVDDKCICENSMHRTYDTVLQQCVILVGHRCAHLPGPKTCVLHAECDILGKCRCKSGYSANSKKICLVDYGRYCQANQCNSDKGLACKEGKCVCLDSMYVWIPFQKRCLDPQEFLINVVKLIGSTLESTPPGQILRLATGGLRLG